MLGGVSGEVRGTVAVDAHSGLIGDIRVVSYAFRHDDTDRPTSLSPAQSECAREIVEHALASQSDLAASLQTIVLSGEPFSPPASPSEATRILADYLQTPIEAAIKRVRKAQ